MSISTYAELQTAVASWLHRGDLTARIPDFIQMGEAVLNRKLRTLDMEAIATLTASTVSRFLALPAGFVEMQSLYVVSPSTEIVYIEPSLFRDHITTGTGQPAKYTLKDQIEFETTPDQAYSIESRYFKRYDIAADGTNSLLTNHPDLYLYSAIASAAFFIDNDARLSTVKSLLSEGIAELNDSESRKRGTNLAYLRVDDGIGSSHIFNVTTGH